MLNAKLSKQEIEQVVYEEIISILEEKTSDIKTICAEDKLNATLGLSSLDLAQLVAVLESKLAADPFEILVPITSIRLVGDLVQAYQKLLLENEQDSDEDSELLEIQKRAQKRLKG